jgi:hypothetical protein
MNPLKAYEITIKGKLEAIPLPDMEDAIWARIEAQLDTDMPTDDGNGGPFDSPSGPWILGSSILAFLLTILTLYYTQKNPDNYSAGTESQNNPTQNSDQTDGAGPPGSNAEIQPVSPGNSTGDLRVKETNSSQQNLQPGLNGQQSFVPGNNLQENPTQENGLQNLPGSNLQQNLPGSNVQQNPVPGSNVLQEDLLRDQTVNQSPPAVELAKDQTQNGVVKPPVKDSVVTGKKSRGVKGVTDSDYRIVPKKDNQ